MGQNIRRRTEPRGSNPRSPLTKYVDDGDTGSSKSRSASKTTRSSSEWWCVRYRCVVTLAFVSVALLLALYFWTRLHSRIEADQLRHAVMMDAGSTGTRVIVYTFQTSAPDDDRLELLDEFFKEVKPGISSYATNPEQAAASIRGLLNDAKTIVPAELRATTTVSLKATAGLRLLPSDVAQNLLNVIREVFASSGFLVRSDAVTIIDGASEGFFLWTTLNFLLDKTSDMKETIAVTDCGGVSAQLALVPPDPDAIRNDVPPEDLISRSVFNRIVEFYIHSYMGMGLMATRLAVLLATNGTANVRQSDTNVFFCPYVAEGANFTWRFQGIEYDIRGLMKAGATAGPDGVVERLLEDVGVYRIKELERRTLYAVSYFYDVAVAVGLIDGLRGGSVTVGDYCRSATKVCHKPTADEPFMCIDTTHICLVFRKGFKLPDDKIINLQKKIKGHETSWALGAALADLHAHPNN